jgi:hypothetical protein
MSMAVSSVISDEEIVDELRAAWAEVSRGYARCWSAMAEVARRTTGGWKSAEIAAALTFTARRADYELSCAQVLVDRLSRVYVALAAGELDHHKARVFADYLSDLTPTQADRICERLVPVAPGWTTGQLAARLLREVQAIDPDYTRRTYQRAVRGALSMAISIIPAPPYLPDPGCPFPTLRPPRRALRCWPTICGQAGIRPRSARLAPTCSCGCSMAPSTG